MKELYKELFYVPKHAKISEKVMLVRVTMTVSIIIMCLAAMAFTAYAYFSYNVTSDSSIIKAANFEANVSITITDSNNDPVTVTKDGKVQVANLDEGKYMIELSRGKSKANKGFCLLTIGDKNYYTDQIGVDAEKKLTDAKVKFELWLSSPTKIEVLSHWGTSVYYGYKNVGSTEIFIVNGDRLDLTAKTLNAESSQAEETIETPSTEIVPDTESSSAQTPQTNPSTETMKPEETITPESTETNDPTNTTEPDTTQPDQTTESAESESTETPSETESTKTTDTDITDTTATEASEHNEE